MSGFELHKKEGHSNGAQRNRLAAVRSNNLGCRKL